MCSKLFDEMCIMEMEPKRLFAGYDRRWKRLR